MNSLVPVIFIVLLLTVGTFCARTSIEREYEFLDICNLRSYLYQKCVASPAPITCVLCHQHSYKESFCPTTWPPDCKAVSACIKSVPDICQTSHKNKWCRIGQVLPDYDKDRLKIMLLNCFN